MNHIGAGGGSGRDAGAIGAAWSMESSGRAGVVGGRGAVVEEIGARAGARAGAGFVGVLVAREESRRTVVAAVAVAEAETTALYEDRRALLGEDMEFATSNGTRWRGGGRRVGG